MARKNLIEASPVEDVTANGVTLISAERPIAGFVAPAGRHAPIGGIAKTLGNITQKFERAQDVERQLAEGQVVVEIDPSLVDGSFISDRLGIDALELEELVGQIQRHGQQVPILVRPHPEIAGRYQVAYGHRRLAAVTKLGIKVRAVVRELSDDQLVVSQGQENNARTNLSYIERALFSVRLEDKEFSRDTIMASIGVDKAALSKMISTVRQIPTELIVAIGAAPAIGRRRWMEFAEKIKNADYESLMAQLSADNSSGLSSDQRFESAFKALSSVPKKTDRPLVNKTWTNTDKSVRVTIKRSAHQCTVTLDAENGPRFADWITDNLDKLYESFNKRAIDQ